MSYKSSIGKYSKLTEFVDQSTIRFSLDSFHWNQNVDQKPEEIWLK